MLPRSQRWKPLTDDTDAALGKNRHNAQSGCSGDVILVLTTMDSGELYKLKKIPCLSNRCGGVQWICSDMNKQIRCSRYYDRFLLFSQRNLRFQYTDDVTWERERGTDHLFDNFMSTWIYISGDFPSFWMFANHLSFTFNLLKIAIF